MNTIHQVQQALGNTFAVYAKVHSFHWNVTGPRFQELHSFFGELYTSLWKDIDDIAETIRIQGKEAPQNLSEILKGVVITECPTTPSASEMLSIISSDIDTLINIYISTARTAEKEENIGIEAFFGERAGKYQKILWMLKSMQ